MYREVSDADARQHRRHSVGTRRALLRHRTALRARPLGAAARSRARLASARAPTCSRRRSGACSSLSTSVDGLDDQGFVVPATHRRRLGLQPRRHSPLARGELGALGTRSAGHRLPPRSRRALDRRARHGLRGARGAALGGHRRCHRRRHEPVRDARRPRARDRPRRRHARRSLHAARAGRVGRPAPSVLRASRRSRRGRCLQQRPARPAHARADDAKYDYGEAPRRLVERAQAIARICGRHGTTLPAAALAFPLGHPAVASVCVGARSAAQMHAKRRRSTASRSLPTCGASSRREGSFAATRQFLTEKADFTAAGEARYERSSPLIPPALFQLHGKRRTPARRASAA